MKNQLNAFKKRKIAILRLDSSADKRAVIVAPSADMTPELMNTLIELGKGNVLVALESKRAEAFHIPQMSHRSPDELLTTSPLSRSCVSVEAREGVTTGISASDRAKTVSLLGCETPYPRMLVQPGHVFPVCIREGGTLVRHALPEGAYDLVRLSCGENTACFIDLLGSDGEFLDAQAQNELASSHSLPLFTMSDIVRYRLEHEKLVTRVAEAKLPTQLAGELVSYVYKSPLSGGEHVALVKGEITPEKPTLVRVQPESTFADVFGGKNPPSRTALHNSLKEIGRNESGVLVYLRRPEIGQVQKQVTNWQESATTKPATMMQEYGLGAQILRDLGVKKIELLTRSTKDLIGLKPFGIEIVTQRPIPTFKAEQ